MTKRILALLAAMCVCLTCVQFDTAVYAAENVIGRSSQNEGMFAVPAPGEVTIDGDLSDWDLSGRIMMFNEIDVIDVFCAEPAVMYDENNLYIAFTIKDPTPMINLMDPIKESIWTWMGDCVQLRFVTDQTMWTTFAYYSKEDRSSIEFDYWTNSDSHELGMDRIIYYSDPFSVDLDQSYVIERTPRVLTDGLQQCFKPFENGQGYVQEIKIPLSYLFKASNSTLSSGDKIKMGVEVYWGDATLASTHEYKCFDNFATGKTISDFFWQAKDYWGYVTMSGTGNIPVRRYIIDEKITGSISLKVDVPKEAQYITLVAENDKGERISNIVSELEVDKYVISEDETTKTVEYMWNGKDTRGMMTPPGVYTIRGISHNGLDPVFDTVFYNPGTPPWPTQGGIGEWGSDHAPPCSVTSSGEKTYVGWAMAEGGHAIIAIGTDGRKMWGENRGANFMTANDKYLFTIPEGGFYSSYNYIMRLDKDTGAFLPFVHNGKERKFEYAVVDALGINKNCTISISGMASDSNNLYITSNEGTVAGNGTWSTLNKVVQGGTAYNFISSVNVLDCETGELKKRIPVPDVGDIATSSDGKVYVVSGKNICEVNVNTGVIRNINAQGGAGFMPGAIAVDSNGNIAAFDEGADSQVKVFSPKGGLLYTAGNKGGRPFVGDFNEQAMVMVSSISFDFKDDIWAVESWEYPRRVSVWGKDGKLVRDYVGNAGYSASGAFLHDQDPDRAFIGPIEIELNRETDEYKVKRIVWVPDALKGESFEMSTLGHESNQYFRSDVSGQTREYIFSPIYETGEVDVLLMENDEGMYRPVFAMGAVGGLIAQQMKTGKKSDKFINSLVDQYKGIDGMMQSTMFMWNDFDGDGKVSYEECEFFPDPGLYINNNQRQSEPNRSGWGCAMTSDLRFVKGTSLSQAMIFKPDYFAEDGAPVYTKNSINWINSTNSLYPIGDHVLIEGTNQVLTIAGMGQPEEQARGIKIVDMDKNGKDLWWYANSYPGVHGSHSAPMPEGGLIIGSIKMLGTADIDCGKKVFGIRGNLGNDYFMTTDGLFIQTLFRDGRLPRVNLPGSLEEAKGMSLKQLTEGAEPFGGWFRQQSDGKYRMVASLGGRSAVVVDILGFDTIKDIEPFKYKLTIAEVAKAAAFNAGLNKASQDEKASEQAAQVEYSIPKMETAPVLNGNLSDWEGIDGLSISKTGTPEKATARLAWDDENLYASFVVTDETPALNSGKDYTRLFKTGDAVDICLSPSANKSNAAADGDMRIVMSLMDGNPVAVLMKQTDKSAGSDKSHTYTSPVMNVPFDRVELLRNADVVIISEGSTYIVEARIPLADIGLSITDGMSVTGDMGIITSDALGQINAARIYHYNKQTELTSDLPQEARLDPVNWGVMKFIAE